MLRKFYFLSVRNYNDIQANSVTVCYFLKYSKYKTV
jgi:hypothetical protein